MFQDLHYGARMLTKKPGFTLVAVMALALGIGANTAIFSVINGVLLKPLGYKDPDRLVKIWEKWGGFERASVAYLNFKDWQDQNHSFEKMAAYRFRGFSLTGGAGLPERVSGRQVSADLLSTLGVSPAIGRDFRPEEDRPGATLVAMISDGLWQRRFGRDPSVIGKTITLNDDGYVVIGVLPADFHFYSDADVLVPIRAKKDGSLENRSFHPGIQVVARLKPGISMAQARADLT